MKHLQLNSERDETVESLERAFGNLEGQRERLSAERRMLNQIYLNQHFGTYQLKINK